MSEADLPIAGAGAAGAGCAATAACDCTGADANAGDCATDAALPPVMSWIHAPGAGDGEDGVVARFSAFFLLMSASFAHLGQSPSPSLKPDHQILTVRHIPGVIMKAGPGTTVLTVPVYPLDQQPDPAEDQEHDPDNE